MDSLALAAELDIVSRQKGKARSSMWVVVGTLVVLAWLIFFVRARPLARTLDRGEVMVLKPLSITYSILIVALAISGAWLAMAVCVLALLFNGAIGASLHRSRTFAELAAGTQQYMQKGPPQPLSDAESMQLASIILRATTILGIVLVTLLLHWSLRWYFAFPAALIAAWAFMAGSTILAAYQKGPAAPGSAAG